MSTSQLSAAHAIWRRRRERTREDKIYALYAFFLVGVIIILPVVRALWVVASSPSGLAVLTSADAPVAVSMYVAALWAGGLLVGTKCGPALLPPFLLHTLTASGIRRALALRRPVLSSMVIVVSACAAGAVLAGTALLNDSQAQLWGALVFVGAVIATGVVTTVLWLTGQAFPRAALPIALTVLVLGGVCLHMPQVLAFAPWGWVGAAYPSVVSGVLPLAGTTVLTAVSIVMIPVLLDRLTGMQLGQQAAQLERATTFSFSFDIRAATAVYEAAPQLGRNFCAIRPSKHRWVTFFIRDVVGQARTPVRSLGAVAAVTVAGILLALSFVSGAFSAVLAGQPGLCSTGPLDRSPRGSSTRPVSLVTIRCMASAIDTSYFSTVSSHSWQRKSFSPLPRPPPHSLPGLRSGSLSSEPARSAFLRSCSASAAH